MRTSGFNPVTVEILSKRLRLVTLFVIIVLSALVLRLWFLQIIKGPVYRTQSENNRIHLQRIPPFRGLITDHNGELLVDNRPSYDLYLVPEDIQEKQKLLNKLDNLISLKPNKVESILSRQSSSHSFRPVLIKKGISREELAIIETNLFNLPGVMIQVTHQRNYIYGKLASHIIGYLGEISKRQLESGRYFNNMQGDLIGKYGIESIWQNDLNGLRGGMQVEVDAAGRKLKVISRKPPVPGLNIRLTIDKDLQMLAEESLKDKKGAIVALDPNNGKVLAMASSPAVDPNMFIGGIEQEEWNRLTTSKDYPFRNRATSGEYPPGSIFKIVIALAALEEGIITPDDEITCTGIYKLGNHPFRCWRRRGHGVVNLHRAIKESCDVYFYRAGIRLGIDKIAHYAEMFGLGRKTSIGLEHENTGLIPTSEWKLKTWNIPWQPGETVSASIGQSFVLVTPLQMAGMISAVFNGGLIYRPNLVEYVGNDAEEVYRFSPELIRKINVKEENLELIKKALIAVVKEPQGTGSRANIKDVNIAGKTGTAQIVNLEALKNRYPDGDIPSEFEDHAWFVAIAPTESPGIACAILIENGGGGGAVAAPIARELIKKYLELYQDKKNDV